MHIMFTDKLSKMEVKTAKIVAADMNKVWVDSWPWLLKLKTFCDQIPVGTQERKVIKILEKIYWQKKLCWQNDDVAEWITYINSPSEVVRKKKPSTIKESQQKSPWINRKWKHHVLWMQQHFISYLATSLIDFHCFTSQS